jgi:hypothetical protein
MTRHARHGSAASLKAVATLAILKVNWDDERDYIANFVPLVAHCVRESGAEAVSVAEIQERATATFGLRIPQGALKTILRRACQDGLVRRSNNVYRPTEELSAVNLDPVRESVLRQHAHLVDRLRDFASARGKKTGRKIRQSARCWHMWRALQPPFLG